MVWRYRELRINKAARGLGTSKLNVAIASAQTPVAVRASSVSSLTPSGTEKRHRAVAASPTRFFELLAEPSAKLRTELLQKASMEFQASGDMGPLQPDTPTNSVRSLLNALLLKQAPNQDSLLLQDMCGDAWIQKSSLTSWRGLGEGAFATVQHCTLKQENGQAVQVAVKKLKPHVLSNAMDLREFLSEANTLRRLKHRHIVEFKGVGCMEPQTPESMAASLYIVQEFMSGSTLKVHVLHQMFPHNSGPVESLYTWLDAFRWLEQIAAALKYLHSLRPMVVHRDLKLENMLLTGLDPATADAKLADFGLCKLVKLAEAPLQHHSQRQLPVEPGQAVSAGAVLAQAQGQPQMAQSGGEVEQRKVEEQEVLYNMTGQTGSLMYMAPEVMKGRSYNEKVDVFSFAVIIFELLSGRVAMAAIGDQRDLDYEAVHAHAEDTANGFRLPLPVNWPASVLSLINDCWAQRSSKRPSFATIERRLQEIKASGIIEQYLAANPKHVPDPAVGTGCAIS
ncbi:MAG: dual specificity kinase splA-like [Trebouxia sp. A1-2]|nr:MAG: dual specificity kinase splA-like [Trebouxia sp. A1-2]